MLSRTMSGGTPSPPPAEPPPAGDAARVVRRRPPRTRAHRTPARSRPPIALVGGVGIAAVVALLVLGAAWSRGPRPTLGRAAGVDATVEALPSAGCTPESGPATATPAGVTTREAPGVPGTGERAYRWATPAQAAGVPVGVVLALPDTGQDAGTFQRLTGFEDAAVAAGVAVATLEPVAPERELNVAQDRRRSDDAVHAVMLLEDLAATTCVDLRRTWVVGWGVGAQMGGALACIRPEYVAAVAGVGGGFLPDACPLDPPVSLLSLWARDDPVQPYDGGVGSAGPTGPRGAARVPNAGAVDVTNRWAETLGAGPTRDATGGAGAAGSEVTMRSGGRAGSSVVLVTEATGGHGWPADANERILQFLRDHARAS
ncbi:MAG: hypothetical protein ACOYOP_11635 [Microthrixaceae bacterium]